MDSMTIHYATKEYYDHQQLAIGFSLNWTSHHFVSGPGMNHQHCGRTNFISPMTNPVFFEDPRTLSEVRFIFAEHHIPSLAGGAIPASDIQVLAMQARAAITEDLSIIATKDGFIWASPNAPLDDGWADVSLGLKYNLWKDVDTQQILSVGGTFELPVGSPKALQGNGSGEFNLFGSYGSQFGERYCQMLWM